MKKFIGLMLTIVPCITFGQLGISFHQSNMPFIGVNYEVKGKIRPELRIGTDTYFDFVSVEGVVTYNFLKKQDYEFYGGLGVRANNFTGLVIPVGVNFYPFETKQFGFHIEAAPIIGDDAVLRGSWGIRYRVQKNSK